MSVVKGVSVTYEESRPAAQIISCYQVGFLSYKTKWIEYSSIFTNGFDIAQRAQTTSHAYLLLQYFEYHIIALWRRGNDVYFLATTNHEFRAFGYIFYQKIFTTFNRLNSAPAR